MSKITMTVALPKGAQPLPNFEGIVGSLTPKKSKLNGREIKTKTGGAVFNMPLNMTRLQKVLQKYPELKKKDNRSGEDIVWLTGFEKLESVGF